MLKLRRVTKVKVFFLMLVYVFYFDLFEFSAAILEKGLSSHCKERRGLWDEKQFRVAFYLYSKKKKFHMEMILICKTLKVQEKLICI